MLINEDRSDGQGQSIGKALPPRHAPCIVEERKRGAENRSRARGGNNYLGNHALRRYPDAMFTQQNCAAWIEALAATPGVKQVCLVHVDGHRLATDAVYPANSKVPTAPPVSAGSAVTLEGEWPIMPTDRVIQVINRLRSAKHLPPLHCELSPIKGVWERGKWSGTLNAHDFEDQPT